MCSSDLSFRLKRGVSLHPAEAAQHGGERVGRDLPAHRIVDQARHGDAFGQVVVDERICMHHLNGSSGDLGIMIYFSAHKLATPKRYSAADSLAGGMKCIFNSFFQIAVNIILFFITAGRIRIFGLPGLGYEPLAMTALPMAVAFMIWAKSGWEQFRYGIISLIIGLGILATQSRAPLLAVIIAIPVLILFAGIKAHKEKTKQPLRTMKKVFIPVF